MNLYICPNAFTDEQVEQARACVDRLERDFSHVCAMSASDSRKLCGDDRRALFSPEESDMVVSLGGDGSVLRAAQTAIAADRPLLGIHSGRLGFLCALRYEDLERFDDVLAHARVQKRTLLEYEWEGQTQLAVNEVVLAKASFGLTVDIRVWLDETPFLQARGDGLIVATPTGSTGYSRSAGGPVVMPEVPALVLSPILPHTPAPPQVIGDGAVVTVRERDDAADVYADGRSLGRLCGPMEIRRAKRVLRMVVPEAQEGSSAAARGTF